MTISWRDKLRLHKHLLKRQWFTNENLEYIIHGPPKYFIISVLAVFALMQLVYYNIDLHNFTKYFDLRGDYLGREDFITYRYKMNPRSQSTNVVVTIGADLRYGPNLMKTITEGNVTKPLASLYHIFNDSDINLVGLDGPITDSMERRSCTQQEKEVKRCCVEQCFWKNDVSVIKAVKELGINGLAIENDHLFDYGREGVEDTIYQLRQAHIPFTGLGYRILYSVKGCNISVLNYNWAYQDEYVFNNMKAMMIFDLKGLVERTDSIIVLMHGGNQNGGEKTKYQEEFAKAAIDNGANVVIGTHSRIRQEPEMYKDKKIYYGLGSIMDENFLGKSAWTFSLLQFEIAQCKNMINMHEISVRKDVSAWEVSLVG